MGSGPQDAAEPVLRGPRTKNFLGPKPKPQTLNPFKPQGNPLMEGDSSSSLGFRLKALALHEVDRRWQSGRSLRERGRNLGLVVHIPDVGFLLFQP